MGGALHPGVARRGASFELSRLELHDERLVISGWWFGVRGMRFVRPALVVDGRQVLATLEHKPWAVAADGSWTAAFPWNRGEPDASRTTLVVAPSVEVPLDQEAAAMVAPAEVAAAPEPAATVLTRIEEQREPLREELGALELRLEAVREELHEARALAAERESRCRELEGLVEEERRAAGAAGQAGDDIVRAHAMAVLDRDRALAQLAEAVGDREAAVRARRRMEAQRDEAVAEREAAEARRAAAIAERDELRRQRDEVVMAHESLRAQLTTGLAQAERTPAVADARPRPAVEAQTPAREAPAASADAPSGVRRIPAARSIAGELHRARRERQGAVTKWDMWAIRVFGSLAALSFITLLVMILKAFFVF
jgi:hypothetical protein